MSTANVVFVLGGPGAGKGTMCELAECQLGWCHLSAGELLRATRDAGGPTAEVINKCIVAGDLVPDEIIVQLLQEAIEKEIQTTGRKNFLLDGFPRSPSNLEAWQGLTMDRGELPVMLYLECPFDILEGRILARAKYTGRKDDNIESIRKRFDTFKEETLPVVDIFKKNGKCVEIDTGQERQAVYALVRDALSPYTNKDRARQKLTERAEILLGLRPYPKIKKGTS